MAAQEGFEGSVVWAGANANADNNVYSWNLTYDADEGETSDFLSTGPKSWIALMTEWSGSFAIRLDVATAVPHAGNSITLLKLYVDLGTTFGYSGQAFIKSINPTGEVGGLFDCTINFRGTGALTIGAI